MKKTLLTLAAIALAPAAFAGQAPSQVSAAPSAATTTEVRYTSTVGLRKGNPLTKLTITRDSSGRIVSVKRG